MRDSMKGNHTLLQPRDTSVRGRTTPTHAPAVQPLLHALLDATCVLPEDWDELAAPQRDRILEARDVPALLAALVEQGLLTEDQAGRIEARKPFGLVLGNYRVLDRLGAGGMGVIFKGEHVHLRRPVAIKVLPLSSTLDPLAETRFLTEMRVVAQLQHPNIVAAMDAGCLRDPDGESPDLRYFVMELVPGQDLEEYVAAHG